MQKKWGKVLEAYKKISAKISVRKPKLEGKRSNNQQRQKAGVFERKEQGKKRNAPPPAAARPNKLTCQLFIFECLPLWLCKKNMSLHSWKNSKGYESRLAGRTVDPRFSRITPSRYCTAPFFEYLCCRTLLTAVVQLDRSTALRYIAVLSVCLTPHPLAEYRWGSKFATVR